MAMGELEAGTALRTTDGSLARVVGSERRQGSFEVFNFEVEGAHNYYVSSPRGSPGVLVHNTCRFPGDQSQIKHIFRNDPGHLADTPANRRLLIDVADDPSTTLGTDRFGNLWSARTLDDNTQVWVSSRNGVVQNGGRNDTPRTFNPETGLSRSSR
ncbi:hypothetical protein DV096_00860 [Bradymonadaceae bacterium TMQ3]|nr:hypothetical protein DV096_00860 [Bradymonadaceae bacterium TMQ3]